MPEITFDTPHLERYLPVNNGSSFRESFDYLSVVERLFKKITDPFSRNVLQTYLGLCHHTGEVRFVDIANVLSVDVGSVYKTFSKVKKIVKKDSVFGV